MKTKQIPFQKQIWCKIRYYQQLHDISNDKLSLIIGVNERTLREYDKSADHITLEKVGNFLLYNNLSIKELMEQ